VTVYNQGNYQWQPGTATVSGDYAIVGQITAPISPGGSAQMTLSFQPKQTGARTGVLTFTAPNPSPLNANGLPYQLSANGLSAGVTEKTAQDGFVLGAAYPNPSQGLANAVITLPSDAKVRVALVRVDGSEATTAFEGYMSQGEHTIALDAKALPAGTYFYVLESGSVRLTRSMIVTR
jgi:hypothetical protein